ncbi:MAG TPA: RluA family pseudouridine synthase [Candidatus Udaeobacter sp.]|nr:RluA family pseudouridine synthase [Candidatus Udaeobacter sp.]
MKTSILNNIKVSKTNADQRLDVFLAKKLKITRSQVQKMIEMEQVFVNNKLPKKPGDNLRADAIIEIKKGKITAAASEKKSEAKIKFDVKIVAETPDYVVVEKPIGMLVHPTMAEEKNTLANFIVKKYPAIKKVGDDPMRPGIVHRLDKEASGLMVIARTQKMFNHLKEQFKNRTITKEYIALVHGPMPRNWDEINFPISRSETSDRMAAIPTSEAERGKEAKTEFLVEKNYVNFSLLRIKIHTGRMHQIRVHMLAYNHPLVGDPLYFQKKQKRVWDERLGRLFLHSTKLGFVDLAGETQEFLSPLPKELDEFLKLLK